MLQYIDFKIKFKIISFHISYSVQLEDIDKVIIKAVFLMIGFHILKISPQTGYPQNGE